MAKVFTNETADNVAITVDGSQLTFPDSITVTETREVRQTPSFADTQTPTKEKGPSDWTFEIEGWIDSTEWGPLKSAFDTGSVTFSADFDGEVKSGTGIITEMSYSTEPQNYVRYSVSGEGSGDLSTTSGGS